MGLSIMKFNVISMPSISYLALYLFLISIELSFNSSIFFKENFLVKKSLTLNAEINWFIFFCNQRSQLNFN